MILTSVIVAAIVAPGSGLQTAAAGREVVSVPDGIRTVFNAGSTLAVLARPGPAAFRVVGNFFRSAKNCTCSLMRVAKRCTRYSVTRDAFSQSAGVFDEPNASMDSTSS